MAVTPVPTNSTDLVEEAAMADQRAQTEASSAPSLDSALASPKQERDSAVRHVGSRIYDRENGISCHQVISSFRMVLIELGGESSILFLFF